MGPAEQPGVMVRYQFQVDDETWEEWKKTVPRTKSLKKRIIELIEADTDGRVQERDGDG
jgi:predicted Rdx family selenoprotein